MTIEDIKALIEADESRNLELKKICLYHLQTTD